MISTALHVDYDWVMGHLAAEGYPLTPSLLAQELVRATNGLGSPRSRCVHGDWSKHPQWVVDSFVAQGFLTAPSLPTKAGWQHLLDMLESEGGFSDKLSLILVSGTGALLRRAEHLSSQAKELVLWGGGFAPNRSVEGWDRVDSLVRVLGLAEAAVCVIVDFEGLIDCLWGQPGVFDIETVLERLEDAAGQVGRVSGRVAFADWHRLPILRDRNGDPLTFEVEGLLKNAGYQTDEVALSGDDETKPAGRIANILDRTDSLNAAILTGKLNGLEKIIPLFRNRVNEVHVWCDAAPPSLSGVEWRLLGDVFTGGDEIDSAGGERGSPSVFLPGLWSRVALLADRVVLKSGDEWVPASLLVSALVHDSSFVNSESQAEALLSFAFSKGLFARREKRTGEREGEGSYKIDVTHPEIVLMRDLLSGLVEEIGPDPGDGQGKPVVEVLKRLSEKEGGDSKRLLSSNLLHCWINFFVDEGILIRFNGTNCPGGAGLGPYIAFSPSPELASTKNPAVRAKVEKEPKRATPRKPSTRPQAPTKTREHLVLVIDNHAVRHGKAFVPMSVIKKRLASYGDAVLTETIRESQQQGDFETGGRGPGSRYRGKDGLILNHESKFVTQVLTRRDRIIGLLKRMAPMGQPIGEGRIQGALVEQARLRGNEEVDVWISMLIREGILKRERQLVTTYGPSYVLSMDDRVVVRASQRYLRPERGRMSQKSRPRPRGGLRSGGPGRRSRSNQ